MLPNRGIVMPGFRQPDEPFAGRMRRIRFRMNREEVRFRDEIALVPGWMWSLRVTLYGLALVAFIGANRMGLIEEGGTWPPGHDPLQGSWIIAGLVTLVAIPAAVAILLIGYVNQDARRRGMNATLWT